ncbi:MAG: helix-turn-helix transcriptional regulator [Lachnospiraceae bacterium]|nr:helix-turn-helix transcriptional regulator [Lachnospiraceae bacterium]
MCGGNPGFISSLRKERNLTQRELGELLHISDKAISKWERGISVPDVAMIENLGLVLEVSPLELMQGKHFEEKKISKKEVDTAFHETVIQTQKQEKRKERKMWILFGGILLFLFIMIVFGKQIANNLLDHWERKNESLYHSSEISAIYGVDTGCGYYIFREQADEFLWNYHVVSVDTTGEEQDLFILQEKGMNLDTAPKLIVENEMIYVIFSGMDNEDPIERVYSGKVGADPQRFMPHLYQYNRTTNVLSKIEIDDASEMLLADAVSYKGEVVTFTQRFRGLLFGLHLGFYLGDNLTVSTFQNKEYTNLLGDGGLNSVGTVSGSNYFILGQDGIYQVNLDTGKGNYVQKADYKMCYRSDIKTKKFGEKEYFVVTTAYIDEVNSFNEPIKSHTEITIYDKEWREQNKLSVSIGTSAIEWGEKSLLISGNLDNFDKSFYVDLMDGKATPIDQPLDILSEHKLDQREIDKEQWVYLNGEGKYMLSGQEGVFVEE